MSQFCSLSFEDLKDCSSNSGALDEHFRCRKCGKIPAEHHVCRNAPVAGSRKCIFILFYFQDEIPYPQGTAFAIQSPAKNILLTAAQNILTDKTLKDCDWFITTSLDRDADGWVVNGPYMPVVIKGIDVSTGIAMLYLMQPNYHFPDDEVLKLCPREDIPNVPEEQEFRTLYCPVGDLAQDLSYPSLVVAASEWKKAYSIQKNNNGKMWLKGGLCFGASGGVVINKNGYAVAIHLKSSVSTRPSKRSNGNSTLALNDTSSGAVITLEDSSCDSEDEEENQIEMLSIQNYSQVCSLLSLNSHASYNSQIQ